MKRARFFLLVLLLLACFWAVSAQPAGAQDPLPVVHAVLFYSPSCPHCALVIQETLPPLVEQYGEQLQIIGFDVTHPQGETVFYAALDRFGIQQAGVPFLVIDNITLTGSQEIPEKFPALIESYLKLGGVGWPEIPGLQEILLAAAQTATAEAPTGVPDHAATAAPNPGVGALEPGSITWQQRFAADRTANTIAVFVLLAMLAALVWAVLRFLQGTGPFLNHPFLTWVIPALCILGFVVAGYLAYVETTNTNAVCGPIGDCNTVQQSPYARLFGVLSIGILGLCGYTLIVIAWAVARFTSGRAASGAALALFGLSLGGTLFSIYLTFLEPFVIGATCAWCLTSAVIMTALMFLTAGSAGKAQGASSGGSPRRTHTASRSR